MVDGNNTWWILCPRQQPQCHLHLQWLQDNYYQGRGWRILRQSELRPAHHQSQKDIRTGYPLDAVAKKECHKGAIGSVEPFSCWRQICELLHQGNLAVLVSAVKEYLPLTQGKPCFQKYERVKYLLSPDPLLVWHGACGEANSIWAHREPRKFQHHLHQRDLLQVPNSHGRNA